VRRCTIALQALLVAATLALASPLRAQLRPETDAPRERAQRRDEDALRRSLPSPQPDELRRMRFISPEVLDVEVDARTYVLGPHDQLAVMILVGEMRLEKLPVLPEGVVLVPHVGAVPAVGLTLQQFRDELHRAVARRYQNFELYCYLAETRQFRVYLTGEVNEPGTLVARPYERVSDVVERAGGFTERASRRFVELRNAAGTQDVVDLDAFYMRGEIGSNPNVRAGSVVHVPQRRHEVLIAGAVAAPGLYEHRPGETLQQLLAIAGGATREADLAQVAVDEMGRDAEIRLHVYNLSNENPPLQNVMRVAVPSALLGRRRVFAILPNEERHTLHLSASETLQDLVRRVSLLGADADLSGARLVTRDETGQQLALDVDVERVLAGEEDRPLQDGDVLSVPPVRDYVYVSGLVALPGRYAYRADWTVGDYIGEAGGVVATGNRDEATVLGAEGDKRGASRGDSVRRGETVHINRSTGAKVATSLAILTNISALVISIVALTR
jgi:protein involved in polysaccharide export with SLBB domain